MKGKDKQDGEVNAAGTLEACLVEALRRVLVGIQLQRQHRPHVSNAHCWVIGWLTFTFRTTIQGVARCDTHAAAQRDTSRIAVRSHYQ